MDDFHPYFFIMLGGRSHTKTASYADEALGAYSYDKKPCYNVFEITNK